MIRLRARSLVLILLVVAIVIHLAEYFLLPRDQKLHVHPDQMLHVTRGTDPILQVKSRSDWDIAIQTRRCIVFVDGTWNTYIARFRPCFGEFAVWCQIHNDVQAVSMMINPDDTSDDVWQLCEQLWSKYDIPRGGLKNYGGAGRVLWLNNGKVVDYVWCMDLMNNYDTGNTETLLKNRTKNAFE